MSLLDREYFATLRARGGKLAQGEFLSWRMLGLMTLMMWNYLFFFSDEHLMPSYADPTAAAGSIYAISSLSYLAASLAMILGRRPLQKLLAAHRLRAFTIMALAVAVGSLLPSLPSPFWSLCLSGILTGLGSAALCVIWGIMYTQSYSTTTVIEVPLAYFFASLVVPLSHVLPIGANEILVALLPLVSSLCLRECLRRNPPTDNQVSPLAASRPSAPINPRKIIGKISVVSLAFGLCNSLMPNMMDIGNTDTVYSLVMPVATLFALAVFVILTLFSRHYDFAFAYKPALLLMVAGYLIVIPFQNPLLVSGFAVTSYTCFNVMNWLLLAEACHRFGLSSITAFSWGRSALVAGGLVGLGFYALFTTSPDGAIASFSFAAMTCVLLLFFGYLCVLTERDIDLLSMRPVTLSQELSPEEQALLIKYRNIVEVCDIVARRNDLGERARDVLVCLAQGYKASDIEEELYMARGTVNTHTNRIYKRLGIHKRKELLDLLEAYRQEAGL